MAVKEMDGKEAAVGPGPAQRPEPAGTEVREGPKQALPAPPPDPAEARKHFDKANEYAAGGMLEIALLNYSRAIELDPGFSAAFNGRGLAYEALGRPELAVDDYDAAIRLRPDDADVLLNRALACRKTGRFDQARRDLESACALKNRRACEVLAEMKGLAK